MDDGKYDTLQTTSRWSLKASISELKMCDFIFLFNKLRNKSYFVRILYFSNSIFFTFGEFAKSVERFGLKDDQRGA